MPLTSTLQVEILFLWIKLCPILDFCQRMDSYPVCLQGTVFFEKGKLWLIWQGNHLLLSLLCGECKQYCSLNSESLPGWSPLQLHKITCVKLQNRWELKFVLRAVKVLWHDFNEIVVIYFYSTRDWTQDLSNAVQAFYHWIILQPFFFLSIKKMFWGLERWLGS